MCTLFLLAKGVESEGFAGSFLILHFDRIRFHERTFHFHGFARNSMKDWIERIPEIHFRQFGKFPEFESVPQFAISTAVVAASEKSAMS